MSDGPVECVIADPRWQAAGIEDLANRAAAATLAHLRLAGTPEIALLAADDARVADLNASFRDKAEPTNVLSWPAEALAPETPGARPPPPKGAELGDIALAYETCRHEAEAAGRPFADHVTHLVVHGVLHLLGYDHNDAEDAMLMESLEIEILDSLGVADPYTI